MKKGRQQLSSVIPVVSGNIGQDDKMLNYHVDIVVDKKNVDKDGIRVRVKPQYKLSQFQ